MNLLWRALLAGFSVALAAGSLLRPRKRPVRRHGSPNLLDQALVAADGTRLPFRVWRPQGEPLAVIVALHAFGDWREGFAACAPLFAARGLMVYAYDQRGFGETRSRGEWAGAETLGGDLVDVVRAIRERHAELPLAILGESMGGAVALAAFDRPEPPAADALVLVAPGVRGDLPLRQLHDVALRLGALALPWLTIELRRGGRPWLLPEEAERFADDPQILRDLNVTTYEGLIELAERASAVPRGALPPTLVIYGSLDTTVPEAAITQLMTRLGNRGALREYPDRHHLLLHEHNVDQVVDDCIAWLEPLLAAARERRRLEQAAAAAAAREAEAAAARDAEAERGAEAAPAEDLASGAEAEAGEPKDGQVRAGPQAAAPRAAE